MSELVKAQLRRVKIKPSPSSEAENRGFDHLLDNHEGKKEMFSIMSKIKSTSQRLPKHRDSWIMVFSVLQEPGSERRGANRPLGFLA